MVTSNAAHASWLRSLATLTAASAALVALTTPATAAPSHRAPADAYAITVHGSRAYPESVTTDRRYVYTASIADGTVYRGRLGSKTLAPFLPGGQDGRTQAAGVKTTGNRLLVAGAFTGRFFVYTKTGRLVASYTVPDSGGKTLVNDATITPDGDVYITDSFRAVVYRIPAAEVHAPATGSHRVLKVAHHLPDYVEGQSNGNGIVTSPDGKSLIIGYWYSGGLYRLTLSTGEVRKIAAPPLHSADGIVRKGNTLYIARSENNQVDTVRLSRHATRATLVSTRTYPGADTTTAVALSGHRMLVTNSQMDSYLAQLPPTSPVFTLESLPLGSASSAAQHPTDTTTPSPAV
ncbi:SMP-30/gluconolactonase/LRE family protein [Streptomyces alboflavus]|uniref:SMP-30/gluconolactonase/LRE family protein n=1 Tax=Streptomyces alboflavus TaxID=67267 RepID=UPI0036B96A20